MPATSPSAGATSEASTASSAAAMSNASHANTDKSSSATSVGSSDASESSDEDSSLSDDDDDDTSEDDATSTPEPPQDIRARLAAFLPRMAAANEELKKKGEAGNRDIEAVGEDEPHIEMSLGLGVLEEKNGDASSSGSSSHGESDDGEENAERAEKEDDVLRKLMGQGGDGKKAGIEDLG
ncbi:hypothetical protein MBLNU230_g4515t1 [Neophaeotheca triangularis]